MHAHVCTACSQSPTAASPTPPTTLATAWRSLLSLKPRSRSSWQDIAKLQLSFLRKRSKIVEILSAGDLVFALTLAGVCEDRPTKSG